MNLFYMSDVWLQSAANVCLQATALLICTCVVLLALRRGTSAARHQAAVVAVLGLLILPVAAIVAPSRPQPAESPHTVPSLSLSPVMPSPSAHEQLAAGPGSNSRRTESVSHAAASSATPPRFPVDRGIQAPRRSIQSSVPTATSGTVWRQPHRLALPQAVTAILLFAWLAGVIALIVRQFVNSARLYLLARRLERVDEPEIMASIAESLNRSGIRRPVRLLRAGLQTPVAVPATWGLLRPVVILPRSVELWPAARLRSVLTHELAHVRRGDWLAQSLAQLACALFWFHPLVWLLARRMAEEAELACDQIAIHSGIAPTEYAGHLLDIVRSMPRNASAAGAVSMARGSQVGARLQAILGGRAHSESRKLSRLAAALLALAIVASALIRPLAAAEPSRQSIPSGVVPDSLKYLCVQSCLLPVAGPGVIVTLNDSRQRRQGEGAALGIIRNSDISLVINTLKVAGAEAIAIGDQRVGLSTVVRASGAEVTVNGVRLQPPYAIRAIGKPELLLGALNSPGGGAENLARIDPAMVHLERTDAVELPALTNRPERKWSHSVLDPDSAARSNTGAIAAIRAFAAFTEVTGPGVKVTLRDGSNSGRLTSGRGDLIIHDRDIAAVLDQLRGAGAEAIAINRIRVTAMSGVRGSRENIIGTNERVLTAPYVIRAIGDPARMLGALNRANGAVDQIKHTDAGMVKVERDDSLSLPSAFELRGPHLARITVPLAFQPPHSGGPSGQAKMLPGGISVELIAVGAARDTDGGDWWKPDGTPLSEEPVRTNNRFLVSTPGFGSQYLTRYLFLRMKGPADGDVSTTGLIVDPAHHLDTDGLHHGRDLRRNDAHLIQETPATGTLLMAFPKSEKRCTYRFGVAAGPWETIAVSRPIIPPNAGAARPAGAAASYPPMIYLNDRPQIYITDGRGKTHTQSLLAGHAPIGDVARRVVTLDRSGREVKLWDESIDSHGEQMLNVSWTKFNRIAEIRLQTRPYEWAEFRNIRLEPAH